MIATVDTGTAAKSDLTAGSSEFRIVGTLHVGMNRSKDGGAIRSVYRMDVDRIEPL